MASNMVDIVVRARDQASTTIRGVGNSFDSLADRASKVSGLVAGAFTAIGAGIGAVAVVGTKYNAMLESSEARWTTLTGSIEGANKQMDFISKYAKSSPFDYQGIDETATSLQGMGMEIKDVNSWIPTLGDMASVMGGGTETIKGVGTALGQMNAKGKVSAEEMMQLAERGVNGWGMLADGMGLSVAEVQKLASEGKLLASDALPLIQEGMNKAFGGGTETYMKSAVGQFAQIQEGASELAGKLTSGAYEYFGTTVLPTINSALIKVASVFEGGLIQGFTNLATGSNQGKLAIALLAGALTALLIPALISITAYIAPIVIAFAPFLAIGVAVGAMAFLIMNNWATFKGFFIGIFEAIKPAISGFKEQFMTSFQALKAGITPLWEAVKTLMNSLKPVLAIVGSALGVLLTVAMAVFNGAVQAVAPFITAVLNLVDVVVNVVMAIVAVFTGDFQGALNYWNNATQSAVDFFKNIWNAIKAFFSGFVGTFISILSKFGIDVVGKFSEMWSNAKSKVLEGVTSVVKFFSNLKSTATSLVAGLASMLISKFTSMMASAKSKVSSAISNIISFFSNMRSNVVGKINALKSSLVNGFSTMMNSAKSKVTTGISSIVSSIKNFGSRFLSAGKGLLQELVKGITSGITKAKNAVSDGMKAIRDFLPFSPAKKGPLSDLDKSGRSFFPTWYEGALKEAPKMARAVGGAMSQLNSEMQGKNGSVALEAFSGGRVKQTLTIRVEGNVNVQGDTAKEQVKMVSQEVNSQLNSGDVFGDLRRISRSR